MDPAETPTYESLDACVLQEMGTWTTPGVAVGVLQDGAVSLHGFGVANLETRQPVTPETLFQIGSISKVFTATLIVRLVEDGVLDLDRPVAAYLPDLELADAAARQEITLRHLLTHTSGLEGDRFDDYGWGDDALAKAIAEFGTLRQITPPGALWTYCNTGFYLAGRVVERVTEGTFEDALRDRLLGPLGLHRSFIFPHEAIAYPVAVGHEQRKPGVAPTVARPWPLPRCVNAAGGVISTVADLLRFAQLHLRNGEIDGTRLLPDAAVRRMREAQTPAANFADAYGIGWALRTIGGESVVGHGGATNGFRAQLTLLPEKGFGLAVLTNGGRGSAAIRGIERWALAHYRGLRQETPASVSLAADDLAPLAGRYEQPHAQATVTVTDSGLRLEMAATSPITNEATVLPPMTLSPIGPREFRVVGGEGDGARVDFIPGEDGAPRFLRAGGRLADRVVGGG